MDELFYQMIFKRKSFHTFHGKQKLSASELNEINNYMKTLKPLVNEIKTDWKTVPRKDTTCKRGEYCILFYSEKHNLSLYNVGYMLEQLDLWLASKNIGACWYGMGKTSEKSDHGLDFVIMMTIEKVNESDFRKDYTKAKRKKLEQIWQGEFYQDIASVARYSPSACNTQPWFVNATVDTLAIYQVLEKRGIMPVNKSIFYNKIDMGIFLLFTELCLKHHTIPYHLDIISNADTKEDKKTKKTIATFHLGGNNNE